MNNFNMMQRTAQVICGALEKMGVKVESDFSPKPIDMILRHSWYVKKAKECGYTHCIHINLDGCFIAVLDNCDIMSGGNFMVMDAFRSIALDFNFDVITVYDMGAKVYINEKYDDEDVFITMKPHNFYKYLNQAK